MEKRAEVYNDLDSQFSFLLKLNSMSEAEMASSCKNIASKYPKDLNEDQLINECAVAKNYFTFDKLNHESMFKTLYDDNLCTSFPNMDILLRIYLCMFVSNVYGERSFSKLKLIKNYLRNTMGDDRLNHLSILAIEHEMLKELALKSLISL